LGQASLLERAHLAGIYSRMRKRVIPHTYFIDEVIAAPIISETALSCFSRPFLVIVKTLSPVKLTGQDTIKRSRSQSSLVATSAFYEDLFDCPFCKRSISAVAGR
jgi:hypothetical protein